MSFPGNEVSAPLETVYRGYWSSQNIGFYGQGRYWVIEVQGPYHPDHGNVIGWRSSLDGITWSAWQGIPGGEARWDNKEFDICYDGTHVHIVSASQNASTYIYYRRGTPAADGSIAWDARVTAYGTFTGPVGGLRMLVRTTGFPVIVWWVGFPFYSSIKYILATAIDGTIWDPPVTCPNSNGTYGPMDAVASSTADEFMIVWQRGAGGWDTYYWQHVQPGVGTSYGTFFEHYSYYPWIAVTETQGAYMAVMRYVKGSYPYTTGLYSYQWTGAAWTNIGLQLFDEVHINADEKFILSKASNGLPLLFYIDDDGEEIEIYEGTPFGSWPGSGHGWIRRHTIDTVSPYYFRALIQPVRPMPTNKLVFFFSRYSSPDDLYVIAWDEGSAELLGEFDLARWADLQCDFTLRECYDFSESEGISFWWWGAGGTDMIDILLETPTGAWEGVFPDGPAEWTFIFLRWEDMQEVDIDGSRPDKSCINGIFWTYHTAGIRRVDRLGGYRCADLQCEFVVRHSSSAEFLGEFFPMFIGSEGLQAEFGVAHWQDLLGEFIVGQASRDLLAEFELAQWQDLLGKFVLRQWYADLLGEFHVGQDSVGLQAEFTVRHSETADIKAEFELTQWADLKAEFTISLAEGLEAEVFLGEDFFVYVEVEAGFPA